MEHKELILRPQPLSTREMMSSTEEFMVLIGTDELEIIEGGDEVCF
jgi:hypothetical protein